MRCFVELSYVGTAYHGWQRQPQSISVQQMLEEKLGQLLRADGPITVVGCGRTDTGVHATQFFAHFDCAVDFDSASDSTSDSTTKSRLKFSSWEEAAWKLNGMLPVDIGIRRIWPVHEKAHARYDAQERAYSYWVHLKKDPFLEGRSARVYHDLDVEAMNRAAAHLLGASDFKSFEKTGGGQKTSICDVRHAQWTVCADGRLRFDISADRFLRNMVRAIVGTLLEVGRGRMAPDDMLVLIASKNRSQAGTSAQACGLYLASVEYAH